MVEFNPRDKGNKPGIAIMIAVKKPKKGEKVKKNFNERDFSGLTPRDENARQFKDENRVEVGVPDAPENPVQINEEVPRLLDINQHGVGPAKMRQQSERINEMSNTEQDKLLDATLDDGSRPPRETGVMTSRSRPVDTAWSMSLPPGMSREDYRGYIKRLEAMIPKEPAPGKDFMTRLAQRRFDRGTKIFDGMGGSTGDREKDYNNRVAARDAAALIRNAEPMDIAWQLLKEAGMDGLDGAGNYPEEGPHIPQFVFRNDASPTTGFTNHPNKLNMSQWLSTYARQPKPPADPEAKARDLANRGFTPQAIKAQNAKNAAAAAALNNNRRLFQPKGG